MDRFIDHFCRNHDGSWTCTSTGTFDGPNGRIQVTPGSRFYPGTMFMNLDLAAWLEQQFAEQASQCQSDELSEERRHGERRQCR